MKNIFTPRRSVATKTIKTPQRVAALRRCVRNLSFVHSRSKIQLVAQHLTLLRRVSFIDAPWFGVSGHRGGHRDEGAFSNVNAVAYGGVHSKKRKRLDHTMT